MQVYVLSVCEGVGGWGGGVQEGCRVQEEVSHFLFCLPGSVCVSGFWVVPQKSWSRQEAQPSAHKVPYVWPRIST